MNNQSFKELTEKYFSFLIIDYDFSYDENQQIYFNQQVNIFVNFANRATPRIEFWIKSEPDFTRFELEDLIAEYIAPSEIRKRASSSIEENFKYYSKIFQKYADKLIYGLDNLVLIALKNRFILLCEPFELTSDSFLQNILPGLKQQYEYIKEKDKNWNPGDHLSLDKNK